MGQESSINRKPKEKEEKPPQLGQKTGNLPRPDWRMGSRGLPKISYPTTNPPGHGESPEPVF